MIKDKQYYNVRRLSHVGVWCVVSHLLLDFEGWVRLDLLI